MTSAPFVPFAAGEPLVGGQRREPRVHAHLVEDELREDVGGARGGVEEDLVPDRGRLLAGEDHGLHRAVGADGDARDDVVLALRERGDRDEREVDLARLEHRGAARRLGEDELDPLGAPRAPR